MKQKVTLQEVEELVRRVTGLLGNQTRRFDTMTNDRRRAVIAEVSKTYGIVYPRNFSGSGWWGWGCQSLHRSIVSKLSRK